MGLLMRTKILHFFENYFLEKNYYIQYFKLLPKCLTENYAEQVLKEHHPENKG